MRRVVAARCAAKTYDAVLLSQPHAYLAGQFIRRRYPGTLFLNRSHGWEGAVAEVMDRLAASSGDSVPFVRGWLRRRMRRCLARHQDAVVEASNGMVVGSALIAQFIQDRYGIPGEKIAVIPHGIHAEYLADPLSPDGAERWRKILYVGQFTLIKAPEQVAGILNRVLLRQPDVTAGWVCDAAHHAAVSALLDPGVHGRVTLYPWMSHDRLKAVFDEYGLFLFPSWYEGCAKAPVEAMSRGLAVVASRVGGPADRIRHGENGYVVEPGEAEAMAARLEALLDDPELARRIGRQARHDVEHITWTNHARQLVAFAGHLPAGVR